MCKKYIILLIAGLLFTSAGNSQTKDIPDSIEYKYFIGIYPSQILFKDIRLSYEKFIGKNLLVRTGAGYKFGMKDSTIIGQQFMFNYFPVVIMGERWIYGELGFSILFNEILSKQKVANYLSVDILMRSNYLEPKYVLFNIGQDELSYGSFYSCRKFVAGLRILMVQKTFIEDLGRKYNSFYELYIGGGMRFIHSEKLQYAYHGGYTSVGDIKPNGVTQRIITNTVVPTIHLGIRIGIIRR
ncbi:MAG: hypothetical protein ABIJ16_02090 [Bacteroidota bacterium]